MKSKHGVREHAGRFGVSHKGKSKCRKAASEKLTTYPIFLGVLIALLIAGATFAITIWAPWIWDGLGRHKRLVQATYFAAFFFAACVYGFRRWRR